MAASAFFAIVFFTLLLKPVPEGLNSKSPILPVSDLKFHSDLSYPKEDQIAVEQELFSEIHNAIASAEEFILIDMFLFYDMKQAKPNHIPIATQLTNQLIQKKETSPSTNIVVITDPFNSSYGAVDPEHFQRLEAAGIPVIESNLKKLRDSNPLYATFWRIGFQWFGSKGPGWLPNVSDPDGPKIPLRSYLTLLNFKANHRKVLLTDKRAVISSANPHGPSSLHSNIGFSFGGPLLDHIEESERAVLRLSKYDWPDYLRTSPDLAPSDLGIQLLTEKSIQSTLVQTINDTKAEDSIDIAMFYLSSRKVIKSLLKASKRGVSIRLILDPNKDAFGRKKSGIPNRPVAAELVKKSNNAIQVRWYNTQGEQFHTKLIIIQKATTSHIFGGSANLTRRNISNYNLETNVHIITINRDPFNKELQQYFSRLWNNENGEFTLDYAAYSTQSKWKAMQYRFQEFTGLGTF